MPLRGSVEMDRVDNAPPEGVGNDPLRAGNRCRPDRGLGGSDVRLFDNRIGMMRIRDFDCRVHRNLVAPGWLGVSVRV